MHIPIRFDRVIERWVRDFSSALNRDDLSPGDDSGDVPCGIKIIFEGYGESDESESGKDKDLLSFAVFIHKDSMSGTFPEHDIQWGSIIHRPKEEACVYVWQRFNNDGQSSLDVIDYDIQFSSLAMERKLRKVTYDMYRREFEYEMGQRKPRNGGGKFDMMSGFGQLDLCHQSIIQWIIDWREKGEKEEYSLDGVGFAVEANTHGEKFTVSLPEEAFADYPKGSNKVVVETCEFGELKKANLEDLAKQVTMRKELPKSAEEKNERESAKESHDVVAKRAHVIGQIQDRINARNQQYVVYFCPDVCKGPKSSAQLRTSFEGLHKAGFELLDDEVVDDFSLVFTPAVCDHAPSPFTPPKSNDNYVSLGFNFSELEILEILAIPSGMAVGTKKNGSVGIYVSMILNNKGDSYQEARKIAATNLKGRKRWQSSEDSDELRIAIVKATRLLGLQIGYRAAKYSGLPMNMFVPTLVPDGSSIMFVQQSIDPSLNEATSDSSLKASFSTGYFSTEDAAEREKCIVGYDDGKISKRTKKCTEFHRYLLSESTLAVKGAEFSAAPWIEIVDLPQEYNFDIYPASKSEMLEAVKSNALVIDVRNAAEFVRSNIGGSSNIPYKSLNVNRYRISDDDDFDLSKLPGDRKAKVIIVGSRVAGDWNSYKAALACRRAGFKTVVWYPGL